MTAYSARDAAKVVGLSVDQVRSYVRSGFLDPERGPRKEMLFSFSDLVLLRAAKGLVEAKIPSRRVRSALSRLRDQLPEGRPITGVQISADGDRVVVRADGSSWQPESGQFVFDFDVTDLQRRVAPIVPKAADAPVEDADGWYNLGCDLEGEDSARAQAAYKRAISLSPSHVEALVNLGRLQHESGDARGAEINYRKALELRPQDSIAAFNLGVALEDQGRGHEAVELYELAIAVDPDCADAHYNLGRLYERFGRRLEALQHLMTYRKLQGR